MKRSLKGAPPKSYMEWMEEHERVYGSSPLFDDLKRPEKDDLRWTLLVEQGFLCAYCGRGLSSDFSDSHVDHFWPQAHFNGRDGREGRRLDHENLFQSCGPGSLPGMKEKFMAATCGDAKGNWYHERDYVIPSDPGCEDRFSYDGSGAIAPKNPADRGARSMIEKLNLEDAGLSNERKKVIQSIERDVLFKGPDWNEVEKELDRLRSTDEDGRMTGFAQVARRYLEDERDESRT